MGNILGNKSMKEICNKIRNKEVHDSEIIRNIEYAKREDPRFDINLVWENWTLLIWAINRDRIELIEYLLTDPKLNYEGYGGTALIITCHRNDVDICKLLLSRQDLDVNIQYQNGWTGLHYACSNNYVGIVKELLLDARVNTSIRCNLGNTAQDSAMEKEHLGIANIFKKVLLTSLLRIPNRALLHDIVRMVIQEY